MIKTGVPSPASDAVIAAEHPSPECGGPCATCAFRSGTEANTTAHTLTLARLCVEGSRPFHCHERNQLCRGFIAAINLRGAVSDDDVDAKRWEVVNGLAADLYADCIARAVDADRAAVDARQADSARFTPLEKGKVVGSATKDVREVTGRPRDGGRSSR